MRRFPLFILVSLGLAGSAWSQTPDSGTPAAAETDPAAFSSKFDQLWPVRDQDGVLKQMQSLTVAAVKANPANYDVLYRAARLKNWEADGQTSQQIKKNYGQ